MTCKTHRTLRLALTATGACIALLLTTGFTPAANAETAMNRTGNFTSRLTPVSNTTIMVAELEAAAFSAITAHARTSTAIPEPTSPATSITSSRRTTSSSSTSSSSSTGSSPSTSSSSSTSELSQAQAILARWIAKYPILAGSTVTFGDAKGYQAICYYRSGRIVISPTHTVSLERIIEHEIGHIIDWRDNGVIDWGEDIPDL